MFFRLSVFFCLVCFCAPAIIQAQKLTIPQGVRILQNKSFDDSEKARQEILNLYKDLRVTDVCDGMDLVGLQDVGLMHNTIRSLWRDVENFTHRFVGFAITVRHVPSDVRSGQNSFGDLAGFLKFKDEQYSRAPDAWAGRRAADFKAQAPGFLYFHPLLPPQFPRQVASISVSGLTNNNIILKARLSIGRAFYFLLVDYGLIQWYSQAFVALGTA